MEITMHQLNNDINQTFSKVSFIAPWFLRVTLGLSFFFFGYGKFPLPSELLISFGFSNLIATLVPLVEVIGGLGIIFSGFLNGLWGQLLTRFFGLTLSVLMILILANAHSDWLITADLFKNIQIYLLSVSMYFALNPTHKLY
jgi:uncharacterized membrane protein YphA (DoxX/SURF4 family)